MKKQRIREINQMIDKVKGLKPAGEPVVRGSGHYALRITASNGATRMFIFPSSPSEHRGELNKLAELRRFAASNQQACAGGAP